MKSFKVNTTPRWRWYKQWEIDGRGKILKRVNYLGRQSAHLPRKRVRYKTKMLAVQSEKLDGANKKKRLTRSSLEEVNQARKVAGLAPLEETRQLRRETGLKPLLKETELRSEAPKKGNFKPEFSKMVEQMGGAGLHAASSNQWFLASPSYEEGPGLEMVESDEANNNIIVERKNEEVNDLGQIDATSAVAWEIINSILEEIVGGDLCHGTIGGH